ITLTAPGFYAPQGRSLRLPARMRELFPALESWRAAGGERLTNLEMETAGIYGLAALLGHHAASVSVLLANRAAGTFSRRPAAAVADGIELVLGRLTES
ncbi:MAG: phosphorylase, partial [Saprospiraceae bacterium]